MQKVIKRADGSLDVQEWPAEGEVSLAVQSTKDQADVNKIVAKYRRTGTITHLRNTQNGVYADLTQITNYQDCLNTIIRANESFMAMPAELRQKFDNDPSKLISYLQDEKNYEESMDLGLRVRRAVISKEELDAVKAQSPTTKDEVKK